MFAQTAWLLIALVAITTGLANDQKEKSDKSRSSAVLVRVNGQSITEADLEFFVQSRKLTAEDLTAKREQLLERLIERQLLRQFLKQKKIAADPKLLDAHLTRLKLRLKQTGDDWDKSLAALGLTEVTLRRELSLPLDWEAYVRQQLTDNKLKEIWKSRRQEFDGTEVRAAHIVLQSDRPQSDEKKLAALRADIVANKLTFANAAKQNSQSPSADEGGDLGRFGYRGRQPPPFPQVAFKLKVGEISEPFRSPFGVHLLTVTERSEGQYSLEDARPEIFSTLSNEMQTETLAQEKAKAKIER